MRDAPHIIVAVLPDKYEWKQNYEILVWNPANTDIINGNTVMILER